MSETIEVTPELTSGREAELTVTDVNMDETYVWLNEEEAVQLVCNLVKVFNIPNTNIEVIQFPEGCNRAEVLRAAADRLDASEGFNGNPY